MEQTQQEIAYDKFDTLRNKFKEGRALRLALAEDEHVRNESRKRSANYLEEVENEKNHMPEWMWNVLWFILGAFFWESIPGIVGMIDALLKAYGIVI